jgi:hypothetical protein
VPTFANRECRVVSATYIHILNVFNISLFNKLPLQNMTKINYFVSEYFIVLQATLAAEAYLAEGQFLQQQQT